MVDDPANPGQKTEVLVPVVYLAEKDKKAIGDGAVIAGTDIAIDAGDIMNSGTIAATNVLQLTSQGIIANAGTLHGGATLIAEAALDIANRSGLISGGDIGLFAGRDIENSGGVIAADNNLLLDAGRDVTMLAGNISAGGDAQIDAGRNIEIGAVETRTVTTSSYRTGKKRYGNSTSETVTQTGSVIDVLGNLALNAGQNISIAGSDVSSGGDMSVIAGNDINIMSAEESSSYASFDRNQKVDDHDGKTSR